MTGETGSLPFRDIGETGCLTLETGEADRWPLKQERHCFSLGDRRDRSYALETGESDHWTLEIVGSLALEKGEADYWLWRQGSKTKSWPRR